MRTESSPQLPALFVCVGGGGFLAHTFSRLCMTLAVPKFYFLKKKKCMCTVRTPESLQRALSFALRSFPDKPTPAHRGLLGAGTNLFQLSPGGGLAACSLLRAGIATWAGAL